VRALEILSADFVGMHSANHESDMPTSTRPDLFALMDAYKVLGVDYSVDPSEIRRALRRLVRQHHPDRCPAGSDEQQQATRRMAEINEAYRLVRDAPLRYHRVSKAADPDTAWTDDELEEAIGRAAATRKVDLAMSVGLLVITVIAIPLLMRGLVPAVPGPVQSPVLFALAIASGIIMWTVLGPRLWHTLIKIQLALAILRVLTSNWSSLF
jgi:DnaJ-domain-containing protein 1